MEIKPIAYIESDFPEKFGIPRQSGLVEELKARVVFLPEYQNREATRGLEQFSHIWLIWDFSEAHREKWSPTVRPPRLGGNTRMGVFATRSPFRPNPLGLSVVRLERVEPGKALHVSGADLMDGTPIFDIKPYLPYVDSKPDASDGFALNNAEPVLNVVFPETLLSLVPQEKQQALKQILAQDPRPQYRLDGDRIYTMSFSNLEIAFRVARKTLTVVRIFPRK